NDKYLSTGIRTACTSGPQGTDLIKKFLKEFEKYLNPNGKVLIIISSKNNLKLNGWKEIDSASFFFEKIYLMKYHI
ncbi:MAG: hypothetical protein KJ773_09680, partial [Candidatus Thermoplasmatota archaeon]|nr:hypothetical protein [Candidatus Thermoplasmatota archaeon]